MVDLPEADRPVNQMVAPCCLRSSLRSLRVRPACQVMLLLCSIQVSDCKLYLQRNKTHVDIFGYVVWVDLRRGKRCCCCNDMQKIRRGSLDRSNRRLLRMRRCSNSPPPTPPARNIESSHSIKRARAASWSNGSVRVGASLHLGVVVGGGRGKLLPMRARLHDFM
jgi:hypothetical protein